MAARLTDLPGVQRPRDALTERMQRRVEHEIEEADAVLLVLNGEQGVGGAGDRFIAETLRSAGIPAVSPSTRTTGSDRTRTIEALEAAADLGLEGEVFLISAARGKGTRRWSTPRRAGARGPVPVPARGTSDQPEYARLAELVREQVLHRTRQGVPDAVEVEVDEIIERDDLVEVDALLRVETSPRRAS